MSIRNKNDIRVYSELPFQINLVGQHREYTFPPCVNGEPTMNFVSFTDIEYAHSRGNLFSAGLLIFNEDEQEEIYNELGLRDWKKKVWFDRDIVDAIENPSLDKMQRIIDIRDKLTFERIRGKVVMYTNAKKNISQNVVNTINARYKELNAGILASRIVIKPINNENAASAKEVADLKSQLETMQKAMEQMAKSQATKTVNDKESDNVIVNEPVKKPVTKKPGRKAAPKK